MTIWNRNDVRAPVYSQAQGTFAQKVYGWMTLGLCTTAATAFFIIHSGLFMKLLPIWWLPMIGTFLLSMGINRAFQKASYQTLATMFLGYGALQGVFFGTVLPLYALNFGGEVIWSAFLTAGGIFGGAALYGMFTKSDLTSMGRILGMGLMGLIGISFVALILSFFMPISGMQLLISYVGLVIFVGLSAYDAQMIRRVSHEVDAQGAMAGKLSLMMALKMYLNVIMLFWYLLQIFSSGRHARS
ncbi:MAG: Bax inhibitor-1/YccA family protein [Verrucomicrobia bacterium]|nr:Bax inhibitor-1/YccA family protein [Verrucomicrobiota bacterium]